MYETITQLKEEFSKYDIDKIPEHNRPDFDNDDITILKAKLETIKNQVNQNTVKLDEIQL